jgi:phage shock protein PspC (stress-responsive transcriptional regulator)
MFCGVAGGIAEYLDIDPTLVRLFFALTTVFCGGFGLLLYLVLYVLMPEEGVPEKAKTT